MLLIYQASGLNKAGETAEDISAAKIVLGLDGNSVLTGSKIIIVEEVGQINKTFIILLYNIL